jgi:hypothetical protein
MRIFERIRRRSVVTIELYDVVRFEVRQSKGRQIAEVGGAENEDKMKVSEN